MTIRARTLINQARTAAAAGEGQAATLLAEAVLRQARVARAMHLAATPRTIHPTERIEADQR